MHNMNNNNIIRTNICDPKMRRSKIDFSFVLFRFSFSLAFTLNFGLAKNQQIKIKCWHVCEDISFNKGHFHESIAKRFISIEFSFIFFYEYCFSFCYLFLLQKIILTNIWRMKEVKRSFVSFFSLKCFGLEH